MKLIFGDVAECLQHGLVDAEVEELHIFRASFEYSIDDVLNELLSELHVVGQFVKRHLRFDHPELSQMSRRVGILSSERRAECVTLAHSAGKDLSFELPADGQRRSLAEEVLCVVELRLNCGESFQVQCCDAKHLPGAFAVTGRDDGCLDVIKPAILEETRERPLTPHFELE